MINVAAEAEHGKETLSSLNFGSRMSYVRRAVSLPALWSPKGIAGMGGGAIDEEVAIRTELRAQQDRLAELQLQGQGGHFGPAAEGRTVERATFTKNLAALEAHQEKLDRLKVEVCAHLLFALLLHPAAHSGAAFGAQGLQDVSLYNRFLFQLTHLKQNRSFAGHCSPSRPICCLSRLVASPTNWWSEHLCVFSTIRLS